MAGSCNRSAIFIATFTAVEASKLSVAQLGMVYVHVCSYVGPFERAESILMAVSICSNFSSRF
jgi:hypothetical protein